MAPTPAASRTGLRDPWVLAAFVTALVLRLVGLDIAPLWLDEIDTARWIAEPWGVMLRTTLSDNHLPLYFAIMKTWTALAGSSPWALRLPSVALSAAMVPLTAAVATTLVGRTAGRWAAWLTAISPYLVFHGQEARMYPLVGALAALHLLLAARFVAGASSLGILFVVTGALLASSHYFTVFPIVATLLAVAVLARERARAAWLPATLLSAAACAALIPVAALLARHAGGGTYDLGWMALPGTVWSMVSGYAFLPSSEELHYQGVAAIDPHLPIAAVAAIPLAVSVVAALRSMTHPGRVLLLATLGASAVGPLVMRMGFGSPVNPRYVMAGAPALFVLLAAGAPRVATLSARTFATCALAALMATATVLQLLHPGERREDVRAVGEWLDANVPRNEEILITSNEMERLAHYHWPERHFRLYPSARRTVVPNEAGRLADALPFPGPDRAIYVVGRAWVSDPAGDLQRALAERYAACAGTQARGIRVLCLKRPDGTNGRNLASQAAQ